MTEEERRRRLIAMGLDPTQYRYVTNEEKAYEETTRLGALGTGLKQTIGPTIGGLGLAATGAAIGAPLGPLGIAGGGLIGGLIGGFGGGAAQTAIEDAALDDAEEQALALKRQVALEKYPWTTLGGQFLPSLVAFRPSYKTITSLPGAIANAPLRTQTAMQKYALANVSIGGGVEAGIEAGAQALRGEEMDWGRVAATGLLGGLLTEPTRAFGKIGATVARKGETATQFLERTGMKRPLTEAEAAELNPIRTEKHQRDFLADDVRREAEADAKKAVEEERRTELSPKEEGDALTAASREVEAADTARMKAHGAWVKAQDDLSKLPKDLADTPFSARANRAVKDAEAAKTAAEQRVIEAKQARVRIHEELAADEARAAGLHDRLSKRKEAVDGTPAKPAPDNLLKIAKGLAAKQGGTWQEKVRDVVYKEDGKLKKARGKYDPQMHDIQLSSLAKDDTPWHEYLHNLWQVLKRTGSRNHRQLLDFFENKLYADSTVRSALKTPEERKLWSEEQLVERGGYALKERIENPPKGWTEKLQRWFDDYKLEKEARKGFRVKKGEPSEEHLQRLADWLAMRGERAPALQPKQLDMFLDQLTVKSLFDDFGPIEGGVRYAKDVQQPVEGPLQMFSRVGRAIRKRIEDFGSEGKIDKSHVLGIFTKRQKNLGPEDVKWNSVLREWIDEQPQEIDIAQLKDAINANEYRVSVNEFPVVRGTVGLEDLDIEPTNITVNDVQKKGFNVYDKGKGGNYFDLGINEVEMRSKYLRTNADQSMIEFEEWQSYDAHQDAVENLSNMLLGEKTPVDVRFGDEVSIPANRKITKTLLRSMVRAYHEDRWKGGAKTVSAAEKRAAPLAEKIRNILEATTGGRGMFRAVQSQFRRVGDQSIEGHLRGERGDAWGYHHITKRPWLNKDDAIEFARKILEDKGLGAAHEGIAMIKGENYKTRALVMPETEGQAAFLDEWHAELGAGRNALGWTRSNRQYLNSDGSASKHIIEVQSPLHQKAAAERAELIRQGFKVTDELGYGDKSLESVQSFDIDHVIYDEIGTSGESTFGPFKATVGRVPDIEEARASGFMLDYLLPDQVAAKRRPGPGTTDRWEQLHKKLSKDPEFTFAGYKYKYDAKRRVLKGEPYTQTFTNKDLRVVQNDPVLLSWQTEPTPLVVKIVTPTNLTVATFSSTVDKAALSKALREGTIEDLPLEHLPQTDNVLMHSNDAAGSYSVQGADNVGSGLLLHKTIDESGNLNSLKITVEPHIKAGEDAVPMVPFRGHKWVDAVARDNVLSAVRDGDESVTWPATIEEINATEGWGDGFHKGPEGEISTVYNLYVHGELTSPDGLETHFFRGSPQEGGGKKSLLDAAYEKLEKDFSHKGAEKWVADELAYQEFEGVVQSAKPDDVELLAARGDLKTIKVHRFKIPTAMRDMLLREGGIESPRYQPVKAEEIDAAVKLISMYDPSLKGKYSKRVRGKMLERIKAGTFSIARGQQILARFASRPFPESMSGEEIAQVVNSLEMYHGTGDINAKQILDEGFDLQLTSDRNDEGPGIYMTVSEGLAKTYGTTAIPIRTNFKKLLDLERVLTPAERKAFDDAAITASEQLQKEPFPSEYDVGETTAEVLSREPSNRVKDLLKVMRNSVEGEPRGGAYIDRNRILRRMGYDGITKHFQTYRSMLSPIPRVDMPDQRGVVAFREPFQKATDQLHEYYGGERLQKVDTHLEDMNEYQLSSATDHLSSNPAAKMLPFLDSVVTRIRDRGSTSIERKHSEDVANALDATARDARELRGEFIEHFLLTSKRDVSLSKMDAAHVMRYMAFRRRGRMDEIPADTMARYNEPDSPVKHYVDYFSEMYTRARDKQIGEGMEVWHPKKGILTEAGQDPHYVPEVVNQDKWRELAGKEGAPARERAKKELVDWWEERMKDPDITRAEIESFADQYIAKLTGNSEHLGSTHFGALRKAESVGLPLTLDENGNFTWIENSAANAYTRYMNRFSRDFSFFKNVENKVLIRQILGIAKQDGVHEAALPQGHNPFHVRTEVKPHPLNPDGEPVRMNIARTTDEHVNDFIKGYLGYYEGSELFGRTANRFVVSHWLGIMSGVRDAFSSYVFALPHLRGRDMPLLLTSIKDIKRSWDQSFLTGVNARKINRIDFATETHNKLADVVNKWTDIVSRAGGRTLLEQSTRALQFGLGRAAVMQQMGLAKGTSITADRTLRRLSEMSGVDANLLRRHANKADKMDASPEGTPLKDRKEAVPEELLIREGDRVELKPEVVDAMLDRMAASWVEMNQGTYDVRGVPLWTLHGPMSLFTSLARWNVEKFNMMKTEIVRPMIDEGDYRPLIKSTLGALFTGTLLIEISEFINNKFRADPTMLESVREEDPEEVAYAVADALNYAGYFGLASALMNDIGISVARGQRPGTGGIVFPAYDFISEALVEPMFVDLPNAVSEGAPFMPTFVAAFHDVLKNTMQTYRIAAQWTLDSEETSKKNIRRDLRIFRRFEGVRGAPPTAGMGNLYLRPATREFKEAETVGESVGRLPAAFEEQRVRAKGRGDKLKSYASGLYTIPDKTVPSISTPEGVEEFLRYRDYIMRQRGGGTWQRIFNDWARNKQLTATKKVLVKSYVQHLVERGAR